MVQKLGLKSLQPHRGKKVLSTKFQLLIQNIFWLKIDIGILKEMDLFGHFNWQAEALKPFKSQIWIPISLP